METRAVLQGRSPVGRQRPSGRRSDSRQESGSGAEHPEVHAEKAAVIVKKVLESAIANAEHNDGADIDELKVKTIYVEQGMTPQALRRPAPKAAATASESPRAMCT